MNWAAELDQNGVVLRVIVGDARWAALNLGGRWVPCDKYSDTEDYPGIGWGFAANHSRRFAPVAPPDIEKALAADPDALPAGSLWWDGGAIETIQTIAARRGVLAPADVAADRPVRPKRP